MRLEDFNVDVAKKVINLWKEHLGFWDKNNFYLNEPELLVFLLNDVDKWVTGRFEERLGSKYTDDSKLLIYIENQNLKVECYAQTQTVFGKINKEKAEDAEMNFNKIVSEYFKV